MRTRLTELKLAGVDCLGYSGLVSSSRCMQDVGEVEEEEEEERVWESKGIKFRITGFASRFNLGTAVGVGIQPFGEEEEQVYVGEVQVAASSRDFLRKEGRKEGSLIGSRKILEK